MVLMKYQITNDLTHSVYAFLSLASLSMLLQLASSLFSHSPFFLLIFFAEADSLNIICLGAS